MTQTCRRSSKLDLMSSEELIEKILLNLPVKSLIRFSTASKLWNSIIFRPKFAQSYRGRETIIFQSYRRFHSGIRTLACSLSSMSSDNPTDETTPFDCHFSFPDSVLASCGNLWCVEFENSLLLYNPSIPTHRKLPDSEPVTGQIPRYESPKYVYGLGYDSVRDDYKILKIIYDSRYKYIVARVAMYSLRSDCWRLIQSQLPEFSKFLSKKGLFVSGAFHWLITRKLWLEVCGGKHIDYNFILSFDLSEEKFALMELPEELPSSKPDFMSHYLDMVAFGGKLRVYMSCVSQDNYDDCRFSVWVMEDYGSKLWIKEMEIDYGHMPPLCYGALRPFYFYDDAGNMVRAVTSFNEMEKMFVYKEDGGAPSTLVEKNFGSNGFGFIDSFSYVESFVCPMKLHESYRMADDDELRRSMIALFDDDDDDRERSVN